jgi:hypothetical protein
VVNKDEDDDTQVYKKPWADLTEWQIAKVLQQCQDELTRPPSEEFAFKFARAIEARIKEKNT